MSWAHFLYSVSFQGVNGHFQPPLRCANEVHAPKYCVDSVVARYLGDVIQGVDYAGVRTTEDDHEPSRCFHVQCLVVN